VQLDSFTLLVATTATLIFLGCALLYFWNRDRRSTWLLWWSVPFLVGGVSILGYLRPNWQADYLTIGIGNAFRIGALGLLWQGARVFERRKPLPWVILGAMALWCGLCLIPAFITSMPARIVAVSVSNAAFCGLAAWELWRGGDAEHLPSRYPAIAIFLSFAAVMMVRVAGVNVLPFPMGAQPLDPIWMGAFDLIVFVHATFLGLLLLAMTKERLELEQRNIAMIDPLTGLMNRRAFMTHVERNARRRSMGREATALLVLDLDDFKSVNDRFGHDVGDRVLAAFAGIAEANARPTDLLFRMGGEEFCFVLPDTELKGALAVAERIRRAFAASAVETDRGERVLTTVSIGVAVAEFAGFDTEVLLAAADSALYEAKSRGRNRVVVADTEALGRSEERGSVVDLRRRRA
jgi:diguanylate cyclase (GGDEF)-like protein